MIGFAAGDLGAAQTAGAGALDALGTQTGGLLHGLLHRAAERNALFELRGDVLGHELRIEVGAADLNDVDVDGLVDHLFDLLAEDLDVGAALADHHAGTGAVDVDFDLRIVAIAALDLHLGNAGGIELVLEVLTDIVVLYNQIAHLIFAGIPTRVPVLDHADAQSVGINFLTHSNLLLKPSRSHRW